MRRGPAAEAESLPSTWISIEPGPLLLTISRIVLAPLIVGVAVRALWTPRPWILDGLLPLASMWIIVVVVGIIVAGSREQLHGSLGVFAVVVLHCSLGFALGTWGTRRMISSARQRTTIGIEVGMQNSGLASPWPCNTLV